MREGTNGGRNARRPPSDRLASNFGTSFFPDGYRGPNVAAMPKFQSIMDGWMDGGHGVDRTQIPRST